MDGARRRSDVAMTARPAKARSLVTLRRIARIARGAWMPGIALTVGVDLSRVAAGVVMGPEAEVSEANGRVRLNEGPTAARRPGATFDDSG